MYYLIRFLVRLGLTIYCFRIRVNDKDALDLRGPMVLASNHPNAFFDAIILASVVKRPVYFLANGELTDKWLPLWALKLLHIIPVYQLSDSPASQEKNKKSFSICADILSAGGVVLFFSEGICENNWQLRPFKKGTARVVLSAFTDPAHKKNLFIMPVGLNYNAYARLGKSLFIQCGQALSNQDLTENLPEAEKIILFNTLLSERISASMLQTEHHRAKLQLLLSNIPDIDSKSVKKLQQTLDGGIHPAFLEKLIKPGYVICYGHGVGPTLFRLFAFALPAAVGWLQHFIIYYPLKFIIKKKTAGTVFYDSVLFATLFMVYPVYWTLINLAVFIYYRDPWIQSGFLFMPLFARAALRWHVDAQRFRNYLLLAKEERNIVKDLLA